MSPQAAESLVSEIAPRIRAVVPRSVRPVGSEDIEELIQDCVAMAAKLLHNNELNGKPVYPSSIAYYSLQHLKSGRRSYSSSRSDAHNSGTQLDGNSSLIPIDEPIGYDEAGAEPLTLAEMISDGREDPSQEVARTIDWESFLDTQDKWGKAILFCAAEGRKFREVAKRFKVDDWVIHAAKKKLAKELREFMGENAIEEASKPALWYGNLKAAREKLACRKRHRGV
jgi:hypothetical protein